MFNAVAKEYLVNTKQDGKLIESRLARTVPELEAAMTRFDHFPLFELRRAPAGVRLLIKAQATLGARTVLSFIPTHVTTGWVESQKFRRPRP